MQISLIILHTVANGTLFSIFTMAPMLWTAGCGISMEQKQVQSRTRCTSTRPSTQKYNTYCIKWRMPDTSKMKLFFDNYLYVDFEITSLVCPDDKAVIKNATVGNIVSWNWDFGNGSTGNVKDPLPQSYQVRPDSYANVKLLVVNSYGCKDSTYRYVGDQQLLHSCTNCIYTQWRRTEWLPLPAECI